MKKLVGIVFAIGYLAGIVLTFCGVNLIDQGKDGFGIAITGLVFLSIGAIANEIRERSGK